MARLTPYLAFHGNCREAMDFYKECLDGQLWIQSFGESPMGAQMPAEMQNRIMHSELAKGDFRLMASDWMDPERPKPGTTVALCLVCESKEEIESLFAKLSAGGNVTHPLKEEFFGTFGDFTDKFGMNWMVQYGAGSGA